MTVKECYEKLEGNYDEIIGRMRADDRVKKFTMMFLADTSFSDLKKWMEEKDYDNAFRAAHTLKGVSQNMAFTRLQNSAHEITEALRERDGETAAKLFPEVETDYNLTVETIKELLG